jgi:hypothetical protein
MNVCMHVCNNNLTDTRFLGTHKVAMAARRLPKNARMVEPSHIPWFFLELHRVHDAGALVVACTFMCACAVLLCALTDR